MDGITIIWAIWRNFGPYESDLLEAMFTEKGLAERYIKSYDNDAELKILPLMLFSRKPRSKLVFSNYAEVNLAGEITRERIQDYLLSEDNVNIEKLEDFDKPFFKSEWNRIADKDSGHYEITVMGFDEYEAEAEYQRHLATVRQVLTEKPTRRNISSKIYEKLKQQEANEDETINSNEIAGETP